VGEPSTILSETKKALQGNSKGIEACETLESIIKYAQDFGINSSVIVDLGLARGLDYYTGPVFEVYAKGYENYGSIAGGGRYDKIVELYGGPSTPMTGIALGVERIIPLLEKKGAFKDVELGVDVYIVAVSEKVMSKAIEVAQTLRRAGISAEIDHLKRSMRKQLDTANKKGVRKAVIIGEREVNEGILTIRNMKTREQKIVKLEDLIEEFQ